MKGVQNFKEKLYEYFPFEKDAIDDYVNLVFASTKTTRKFYIDKVLSPILSLTIGSQMRNAYYKFSDQTTYDVLKSLTDDEELIKVLAGQYGNYGVTPKKSSFAMHASVARHYFGGGSFPIGGSSQIAKTINPLIEAAGGIILTNAEVKEVRVINNKATGVLMNDGKVFTADNIVSGAGIMTTYHKVLPENVCVQHKLKEQLQKIERSISHACLHIGLKGSPQELKLPKTNYYFREF